MKSYLFSALSAVLFVAGVSAQLTVNTPTNVLSCTALQITWTGGTAPYTLSVHPGAAPNDPALETFPTITSGNSYTWSQVNFASGTSLDLTLRDSTGLISQSAPFTVQAGSDTSCLSGNATTTAAGTTTPGGTTAGGSTAPATATATTPATGTTSPRTTTSTGSSANASRTSTSSPNGAMPTGASYGAAGVIGAVVAVVFA